MYAPFMFNTTEDRIPYILFYDTGDQVVPTHWHKEIEFSYSLKGDTRILVNDKLYEIPEGEAILINGGDTHFYFSTRNHNRIVIILDLDIIQGSGDYLDLRRNLTKAFSQNDKTTFSWSVEEKERLRQLLHNLEALNKDDDPLRSLMIRSHVYELLYMFSQNRGQGDVEMPRGQETNKAMERLERVFSYIEENYQRPIMLDEVADVIGLDPAYFTRFFKRYTHTTFVSYLQAYRITKAQYILVSEPDKSIGEIAEEVGFQSIKTFNRTFKELTNTSPLRFRKVNI